MAVDSGGSSTLDIIGQGLFSISYVDGSHSDGSYFTDVFTIGGSTVTNMTMGLGEDTDINFGLVGIGYKTDEAIVSSERTTSAAYNNLPVVLMNEGITKTVAFSLWLNDLGMFLCHPLSKGMISNRNPSIHRCEHRQSPFWRYRHRKVPRRSDEGQHLQGP